MDHVISIQELQLILYPSGLRKETVSYYTGKKTCMCNASFGAEGPPSAGTQAGRQEYLTCPFQLHVPPLLCRHGHPLLLLPLSWNLSIVWTFYFCRSIRYRSHASYFYLPRPTSRIFTVELAFSKAFINLTAPSGRNVLQLRNQISVQHQGQ